MQSSIVFVVYSTVSFTLTDNCTALKTTGVFIPWSPHRMATVISPLHERGNEQSDQLLIQDMLCTFFTFV